MAVPEGEEGGQVMFEWEEQDRFSFEDSDRFEEVALTFSFISIIFGHNIISLFNGSHHNGFRTLFFTPRIYGHKGGTFQNHINLTRKNLQKGCK